MSDLDRLIYEGMEAFNLANDDDAIEAARIEFLSVRGRLNSLMGPSRRWLEARTALMCAFDLALYRQNIRNRPQPFIAAGI
jgi:hypothetical protein